MTILNTIDIFARDNVFCILLAVMLSVVSFICFVSLITDVNLRQFDFIAFTVGCFASAICFTIGAIAAPNEYCYTQIECLIDETVTAQDVLDNYELIERRGEIYVLKYIDQEKLENKEEK